MKTSISRLGIVLIAIFSLVLPTGAARVTSEQAMRAARNWLRRGYGFERRMGADIESVRSFAGTNGAAFHIAAVKGGGFVVLGSDTEDSPVVAVSAQGRGEPDERSPLWALLRQDMAARILAKAEKHRALHAAAGMRAAAGSSPEGRWAKLLEPEEEDGQSSAHRRLLSESDGRTTIADVRVDALLQSAWSQTDYRNYGYRTDDDICYNYYTPYHWPCGCVATAGAQVMRYHSYPTAAVGAGTYVCRTAGTSGSLTMYGGKYNWAAMTLVPANGCSATSREAIGRLTYDVGVSVGMSYRSGGSSSAGYMLSKRFVDRFQYANAASVVFQDGFFRGGDCSYTLARFKSAVIPNFDAGLPVVLGISGSGGHAVVGDGYGYSDGDFFVHINLGWANLDNGNAWYMPPNIERYTSIDSIVYNVYPTGASGASIVSGRILSAEGLPVEDASVKTFADGAAVSVAASGAKGTYALKVSPGTYWVVAEKDGQSASNRVTVSACVSPHLTEDGSYYDDICPQVGNVCDSDLTLDVAGTPEPPPPPPPENLTWHTTKAEAFAAAQASGKRILLVYGRDTCGNTTATRNSTCEDATVKAKLLADYVLWYSNCDTQSSESGKYLMNFNGYLPGVTVIDPELDKGIVGTSGYLGVSGMLELLAAAENWVPPEPPENDKFADAAELTGASGSVTATNEAATNEDGEPLVLRWSSATTTVWWKWTAPEAGSATFDTVGSAFDTVMGIYSGSALRSLTTIAQDDDGGGGRVSKCTFDCTAGTTYYVCIGGYSASFGNISLQWSLTAADPQLPADGTYTQTVDGVEWVYTIEDGVAILGYNIGRTPGAAALRTDTTGCVTVPASFEGCPLQVIGPTAFEGCAGITEIVIPESVRRIDWYAFNGCKSLLRIVLPPNLDSIGSGVFHYCERLQGIEIPSSVTQISSLAFGACTNFQDFVVQAGNEDYVTRDGILFASDEETLVAFPGGRQDVVFPQGVVKLGDYSFYGGAARRVCIPESVRELGTTVFMNSQIEEIDFGAALREIPESTCDGCRSLVNVTLWDGLVEIGEWAFDCCSSLGEIAIPASVDKIGQAAFRYCSALSRVDFAGAPPADVAEDAFVNVSIGCIGTYRAEHAAAWSRAVDGNGMWKGLKMECAGDPPAPEEQPVVYEDLDQAKAAAMREGKLVFLLSGADWCPYTTQLKQYIDDAGSVFADNYVYLWHDQDEDAFGIAATSSIPEFWIFRPSDLSLTTKASWDTVALFVCEGCPTQYDYFLQILELYAEARPSLESSPLSVAGMGWHEVSFPVLPEGGDPADVFAPVADKIGFVTYGSKNWSPTTGGTLTALEVGKGYWVQTTAENVAWTVTGQGNPDVEIALKAGWNLIGYPLLEEGEVEAVLATALATGKIVYIYSGSRVYPGPLTTLAPGKGYWVYANAAVTIRFDFNE